MYWLTKTPCPECHIIFPLHELNYIQKILRRELKREPSNGWPREHCNWNIGLVKVYVSGMDKKHEEKEFKMQCFVCGYEAPEEDVGKRIKDLPRPSKYGWRSPCDGALKTIKSKDKNIQQNEPEIHFYLPPLEAFDLENRIEPE